MKLETFVERVIEQICSAVDSVPGAQYPEYVDIETSIAPQQVYYETTGMITEIYIAELPEATRIKFRIIIKKSE